MKGPIECKYGIVGFERNRELNYPRRVKEWRENGTQHNWKELMLICYENVIKTTIQTSLFCFHFNFQFIYLSLSRYRITTTSSYCYSN
jgi:hypothetical protein